MENKKDKFGSMNADEVGPFSVELVHEIEKYYHTRLDSIKGEYEDEYLNTICSNLMLNQLFMLLCVKNNFNYQQICRVLKGVINTVVVFLIKDLSAKKELNHEEKQDVIINTTNYFKDSAIFKLDEFLFKLSEQDK
jgi:hypothetical protein